MVRRMRGAHQDLNRPAVIEQLKQTQEVLANCCRRFEAGRRPNLRCRRTLEAVF